MDATSIVTLWLFRSAVSPVVGTDAPPLPPLDVDHVAVLDQLPFVIA
jgi:hypothetical protein